MSKSSPVLLLSWWSPLCASLLWALLAVACVDAEEGADAGVPVVVVADAGCVDDACPACIDGAAGCACTAGGCDSGLVCVDDVCVVDPGCVGAAGCVCGSDGACDAGLSCGDDDRCGACEVGDVGCACRANLTCNDDDDDSDALVVCNRDTQLCELVVDDSEEPGVLSRACFTPCGQSLTAPDGTFRFCDADGLMAGCIGARQCVDGSCLAEGEVPNTCVVAADCSDFQACVSGRCMSNCDFDPDCGAGARCSAHVCRARCTSTTATCADGFVCKSDDGIDGVCMPEVQVVPIAQVVPSPRLTVTPATLSFSNNRTSGSVRVTNTADRPVRFEIARTEHFEFTPEGRVLVDEAPLFWPRLAVKSVAGAVLVAATRAETVNFDLVAGDSADVVISDVDNDALSTWEGRLTITGAGIGSQPVWLDYATQPDGQWTGTLHSFIHFDDRNIDTWVEAMRNTNQQAKRAAALVTENALLVQWTQFRTNPLFVLAEWEALLQSVTTGNYAFSSVNNACRAQFNGATQARCYLYSNGAGVDPGLRLFTDTDALRIPSGMIDMPVTLRLTQDSTPHGFTGRIETSASLQYGGKPAISVTFAADPSRCEASGSACLATISGLHAEILVGGRSLAADDGNCVGDGAVAVETPWLLEDFVDGTVERGTGRVRRECRESRFPFAVGESANNLKKNASLAAANPIPDGRVRRRQLDLLDGVMVNQDTMHVLVRERFDANLVSPSGASSSTADFTTYGVLVLRRSAADLAQEVAPYEPGIGANDVTLAEPVGKINNQCSAALLDEVGASTDDELARRLLFGFDTNTSPTPIVPGRVHVLCHATGNIDGGRSTGVAGGGEACPVGSGVTFFLADGLAANAFANNACQSDSRCSCVGGEDDDCVDVVCSETGTCADELRALSSNPANRITLDVPFQCNTPGVAAGTYTNVPDRNRVQCNDDRFDLRVGKLFYDPTNTAVVTPSLRNLIDSAFRYKSRFESRSDTGAVGFVPAVCALNSDALPYCYDPAAIEAARERVSCLMALFSSGTLDSNGALAAAAQEFLEGAFSLHVDDDRNRDGFERLYAELLIMLGDASLTDAVGSRFDLSGGAVAAFEGDLLEPGGLRLSGGAGHEMQLLYTAHQYYQLVLDRFAQASPTLWQGLSDGPHNVLSLDSIATYLRRVIQASTKKAQAASEIARRYQSFDRSDLARHVVERAYTEAYLESATISQLMRRSIAVLDASEVDALQLELDNAQRQYRQALEQMREVYQGITDELTFFGIAPDFIPFPAPGRFSQPAPRIMFERAFESLNIAKERENRALEGNRAFDVDAAQFQAELARVRQQYESQLSELCGVFTAADGVQYPAITKYADASAVTAVLGDPCGLLGQGTLFEASSDIESLSLALRAEIADLRNLIARVEIENARVEDECASRVSIADLAFVAAGERITLRKEVLLAQQDIGRWEKTLGVIDRSSGILQTTAAAFSASSQALGSCGGINPAPCLAGISLGSIATGFNVAAAAVQTSALGTQIAANEDITSLESDIRGDELAIEGINRDVEYDTQLAQCCLDPQYLANPQLPVTTCAQPGPILINSQAQVDTLLLDLKRASIEAARAEVDLRRGVGRLAAARAQVTRLLAQQDETEDHLINVEAARNDPNIRIFANADVLNADVAFHRAVVDAFRATRMYEYYTATSYANKDSLYLVRLAGRGENNLEDYVIDLQRDFNEFEQDFGVPQQRVLILSLMDDILKIPKLNSTGGDIGASIRNGMLYDRLSDPELLDDNGVIRVPFATTADLTSPITANHKITFIEAEITGGGGDALARVNLRAKGTATIRDFNDRPIFHRLSPDTAVINAIKGGVRTFGDDVYQNDRLRDRPLINSLWELGLDLRNESVNSDLNLSAITDIRVRFFYEDFTRE
jgi:hypothetical protein